MGWYNHLNNISGDLLSGAMVCASRAKCAQRFESAESIANGITAQILAISKTKINIIIHIKHTTDALSIATFLTI
jgi:hypothetical protein